MRCGIASRYRVPYVLGDPEGHPARPILDVLVRLSRSARPRPAGPAVEAGRRYRFDFAFEVPEDVGAPEALAVGDGGPRRRDHERTTVADAARNPRIRSRRRRGAEGGPCAVAIERGVDAVARGCVSSIGTVAGSRCSRWTAEPRVPMDSGSPVPRLARSRRAGSSSSRLPPAPPSWVSLTAAGAGRGPARARRSRSRRARRAAGDGAPDAAQADLGRPGDRGHQRRQRATAAGARRRRPSASEPALGPEDGHLGPLRLERGG